MGRISSKARPGIDRQPSSNAHSPRDSRTSGLIDDLRALADVVDEDPLLDADLRAGQAEAGGLVHGGEHVVGQARELAVDVGDLPRPLAEDGIADQADLVGRGHPTRLPVGSIHARPGRALLRRRADARHPAPATVRLDLPDRSLTLTTDRGVFSADRVDPGTKYLLLEAPAPPADRARSSTSAAATARSPAPSRCGRPPPTVWAVDVNERAARPVPRATPTRSASPTSARATPDDGPDDLAVDLLWSNPPIRIGKAALHDLLGTWLGRLAPTGSALLVVQKHLGADSLQRWLDESGWAAERIGSRTGYRLLQVTHS